MQFRTFVKSISHSIYCTFWKRISKCVGEKKVYAKKLRLTLRLSNKQETPLLEYDRVWHSVGWAVKNGYV